MSREEKGQSKIAIHQGKKLSLYFFLHLFFSQLASSTSRWLATWVPGGEGKGGGGAGGEEEEEEEEEEKEDEEEEEEEEKEEKQEEEKEEETGQGEEQRRGQLKQVCLLLFLLLLVQCLPPPLSPWRARKVSAEPLLKMRKMEGRKILSFSSSSSSFFFFFCTRTYLQ